MKLTWKGAGIAGAVIAGAAFVIAFAPAEILAASGVALLGGLGNIRSSSTTTCNDGWTSNSAGKQGCCSSHGGDAR